MDNLHKRLIELGINHMYKGCDNPDMVTTRDYTECHNCGFYKSRDDIDYEGLLELERAYQIAYKYRTNILRIRRLLDQSPVTIDNGARLVNAHTGKILLGHIVKYDDTLSEFPYISLGLMR